VIVYRLFVVNCNAFSARRIKAFVTTSQNTQFIHNSILSRRHKDFPGKFDCFSYIYIVSHSYTLTRVSSSHRLVRATPSLVALGKPSDKLNRCVHVHRRDAINSVHRVLDWSNELYHLRFATHRWRQRRHSCTTCRCISNRQITFFIAIGIRLWRVEAYKNFNSCIEKVPFISMIYDTLVHQ